MNIEKIEINKLKAATYNPRQISTKQYKDLKESINKFGLVDPIIVNKCYTIIGGHQRYKICKDLDYKDIGCIILDLNKEQERELNIRLNKNTGDFDMDILANEFDIDELVDWGFKHIDLDVNIDKIVDEDNSATITIKEDDEIKAQELYNDLKKQGYNVKIK
jgi:ParB-like chromosome segregation protein Spo0J